jgi:hypothetical protein
MSKDTTCENLLDVVEPVFARPINVQSAVTLKASMHAIHCLSMPLRWLRQVPQAVVRVPTVQLAAVFGTGGGNNLATSRGTGKTANHTLDSTTRHDQPHQEATHPTLQRALLALPSGRTHSEGGQACVRKKSHHLTSL